MFFFRRPQKKKIFVLGLDGAVKPLIDRPQLPYFEKLLAKGFYQDLISRPAITSVAWPSMVSGVNAGKHGIFGFRVGEELFFADAKKAPELWDYLPSIALNIPMTYPVRPIEGIMISGMMTPDWGEEAVYPSSEIPFLREQGFVFEPEINLEAVQQSMAAKIKVIKEYFHRPWELFFVVFREFDVLQHFFWGQEIPFYQEIENLLRWLLEEEKFLNSPENSLLIVSDHGFAPVSQVFDLEQWIKENGWADKVFVGGWGSLYLRGGKEEKEKNKKELEKALKAVKVEDKEILDVYPREEIYWGPWAEKGPDLVVSPRRQLGFTFGLRTGKIISPSEHKNGCHLEEGIFLALGERIRGGKKEEARIFDVFATIMELAGHKLPPEIDGEPLLQLQS